MQLAGALMLAFGITAKVDKDAIGKMFSTILPQGTRDDLNDMGVNLAGVFDSNSTYMIVLGAITVIIAIFGFVGACWLIRWMLVVVS